MDLLPVETVSCPRCASVIGMGEMLADTQFEQVRVWVCTECSASGWIGLAIAVTRDRPRSAPRVVVAPRVPRMVAV